MGRKGKQGFASMDKKRLVELAREGGTTAHRRGTKYKWTPELAREAARKALESRLKKKEALNEVNKQDKQDKLDAIKEKEQE